jgi:hypothetical protein
VGASASRASTRSTRTLAELERKLPEFVAEGDITGLLGAQALALAVASSPVNQHLRRKARRLARRAESAAEKVSAEERALHPPQQPAPVQPASARSTVEALPERMPAQNGAVPPTPTTGPPLAGAEHSDAPLTGPPTPPIQRGDDDASGRNGGRPAGGHLAEVPPPPAAVPVGVPNFGGALNDSTPTRVEPEATPETTLLRMRLMTLLGFLAKGDPPALRVGASALRSLYDDTDDNRQRLAFQDTIQQRADLLLYGYRRGRAFHGSVILGVFRRRHRRQIARELKSIAVELMNAGADVGIAMTDPVPLVAYALLVESLPVSVEPASPEGVERINDLLLEISRAFQGLPEERVPLLSDAFALSVILGESERYTDQLGLLGLNLVEEAGPTAPRRRRFLIPLAAAAAAAATLVAGYVAGSSGGGHAANGRITVTERIDNTKTVHLGTTKTVHDPVRIVRTRTRTIPITTTVVKKVAVPGARAATRVATTTVVLTTTVESPRTLTTTVASPRTLTTTVASPRAPVPAPRTKTVVPAACATAIANGRSIALLAISDFPLFAEYAKLASEAVAATTARDAAKMAAITKRTNAIGQTLSQRAQQISRLGDAFNAGSAQCRP